MPSSPEKQEAGGKGGEEGYSFAAGLSQLANDHASLSRRSKIKGGGGGGDQNEKRWNVFYSVTKERVYRNLE